MKAHRDGPECRITQAASMPTRRLLLRSGRGDDGPSRMAGLSIWSLIRQGHLVGPGRMILPTGEFPVSSELPSPAGR